MLDTHPTGLPAACSAPGDYFPPCGVREARAGFIPGDDDGHPAMPVWVAGEMIYGHA